MSKGVGSITRSSREYIAICEIFRIACKLRGISAADTGCTRIRQIPGIGPVVATAIVAAIGNGAAFGKGRDFAAWPGIVPRRYSTRGKAKLLGISKRGIVYLGKILIHVARAAVPRLEPGHVVILDNLGAHKMDGVRQSIESRGAFLLYLPPYSPDFNPIKQAWSKLKQLLRGFKARLVEQLEPALTQANAAITTTDAQAFFYHRGYRIQQL